MRKEFQFPQLQSERPCCSICEHPRVFFECTDKWVDKVEFHGSVYLIHQFMVKKYCKDCFEEYGGSSLAYV